MCPRTEVLSSALRARTGRHLKTTTTVGLEIGEWRAPDGKKVSVVGTPGQERFDLVRQSAMPRSTGVVLWLFGHHDKALLDAELWLEFISNEVATSQADRGRDQAGRPTPSPCCASSDGVIDQCDARIPLVAADPRDRAPCRSLLPRHCESPRGRRRSSDEELAP